MHTGAYGLGGTKWPPGNGFWSKCTGPNSWGFWALGGGGSPFNGAVEDEPFGRQPSLNFLSESARNERRWALVCDSTERTGGFSGVESGACANLSGAIDKKIAAATTTDPFLRRLIMRHFRFIRFYNTASSLRIRYLIAFLKGFAPWATGQCRSKASDFRALLSRPQNQLKSCFRSTNTRLRGRISISQ